MTFLTEPLPLLQGADNEARTDPGLEKHEAREYWWATAGQDLARMMSVAEYPEEAQHQFLDFFRETVIPQLGSPPDSTSGRSGMAWDGSPFEYSFELKGSSNTPSVRFVVDMTQLRPIDTTSPLDISKTQTVIDVLAKRIHGFDDTWHQSLLKRFTHSHLGSNEQAILADKAGHQSSIMLGFDIDRNPSAHSDGLPVMGKVYYLPCFAAAHEDTTRWQIVRLAIRDLPYIHAHPNILHALGLIETYLAEKPRDWEDGARYLATDFVEPGRARLKIYLRIAGDSTFENIWDFYTLGGRIAGLEGDRDGFCELMELTSGRDALRSEACRPSSSTHVRRKATTLYFSLSADSPWPAPKICIYPANFAANDESIIRGMDAWLVKNGINRDGVSMEDRLKSVFTHRKLEERTGIVTFIGIGRKEGPSKQELSMQIYVTPELYASPRG